MGSEFTKPKNLPDLDGNADLVYQRDSNSDMILTTRMDVTRYDDHAAMPDNFEFKSGLWIATVNSVDGQKPVKLITR